MQLFLAMQRKKFIASAGLLLSGLPLSALPEDVFNTNKYPETLASDSNDEGYWNMVRNCFNYPKDFTNLENGYFSPQPISTEQYHQKQEHYINTRTSWFMRREQSAAIENTRIELARFLGCSPETLAITRNTTESLNTVISGYPWNKGDEVIIGNQDYGSMVAAFKQQAKRYGIIIKTAQIPLHPKSDEEIIQAYLSLATSKTKIIHLTHLINLSGQVLPARKIIDASHARGIEVMVDAAHSVAHIDFKPGELDADYLGASLHKWLCCPLGVGILMVKEKHISKIWPLLGDDEFPDANIRRFQHQGTRPIQTLLAINEAIRFHEAIGSSRKEQRLRFLKNYWVNKVKSHPAITINTPTDDESRSCAIANVAVKNLSPAELSNKLFDEYKVFTVAIDHEYIKGVRVTPHLYTTTQDLDKLVDALLKIAG